MLKMTTPRHNTLNIFNLNILYLAGPFPLDWFIHTQRWSLATIPEGLHSTFSHQGESASRRQPGEGGLVEGRLVEGCRDVVFFGRGNLVCVISDFLSLGMEAHFFVCWRIWVEDESRFKHIFLVGNFPHSYVSKLGSGIHEGFFDPLTKGGCQI